MLALALCPISPNFQSFSTLIQLRAPTVSMLELILFWSSKLSQLQVPCLALLRGPHILVIFSCTTVKFSSPFLSLFSSSGGPFSFVDYLILRLTCLQVPSNYQIPSTIPLLYSFSYTLSPHPLQQPCTPVLDSALELSPRLRFAKSQLKFSGTARPFQYSSPI